MNIVVALPSSVYVLFLILVISALWQALICMSHSYDHCCCIPLCRYPYMGICCTTKYVMIVDVIQEKSRELTER